MEIAVKVPTQKINDLCETLHHSKIDFNLDRYDDNSITLDAIIVYNENDCYFLENLLNSKNE
jgi:hypothetical protein